MHNTLILIAALVASAGAGAEEAQESLLRCPPGTAAVTTGIYHNQSCIGSNVPGLVRDTLPYSMGTLYGSTSRVDRPADPIFPMKERPSVSDGPRTPAALGHIAAASTDLSAFPSGDTAVPNKLVADWTFLFEGGRVLASSRIAWMGGSLSRSPFGELMFSTTYGSDSFHGSIERYRYDVAGFLSDVGPATAHLFSERYGSDSSRSEGMRQANAYAWDRAVSTRQVPGATAVVGGSNGSDFVTVIYDANGMASHVATSRGVVMPLADFVSDPEFTAVTGRGVAFGSRR
jgi:hypothetical protein